jgi:hypothetical protein
MGRTCGTYGDRRCEYGVLVGDSEGRKPLGRPRPTWKHIIKNGSSRSGMGDMDWIDLAQDSDRWRAVVNAVMNIRFLYNAGNFFSS